MPFTIFPDASIIIVSFNTRDLLRDCLRTVKETCSGLSYEIIVVDNASRDGSAAMVEQEFPEVRLIHSPINLGFAAANNRGFEIAQGRMICYEFKGGSGTSSRKLPEKFGAWTVGAFAQTNFGARYQLTIAGVPVGHHLKEHPVWTDGENPYKQDSGSLIVILATDAPLLPHQLKRIAKRASLGMARTGSLGGNGSGDIFLAFSTANPNTALGGEKGIAELRALDNDHLNPLFAASAFATEEAIINSMVAAEDMTGHNGFSVKALTHEELREVMRKYGRLR